MIRVSELKLPIEGNQKALEKKLAKALRVPVEEIKAYRIFKRSLDARKKDNIHYAYVVDVEVKNEKKILEKNKDKNISETPDLDYKMLTGERKPEKRPVVVGFGCRPDAGGNGAESHCSGTGRRCGKQKNCHRNLLEYRQTGCGK